MPMGSSGSNRTAVSSGASETMAMIPLGWPVGTFAPPARLPAEKVAYWDAWGATATPPR